MPFSHDAFLDVFGAYNSELWVLVVALWIVTIGIFGASMMGVRTAWALIPPLLAVQWLWAGLVYHAAFFVRINPAAWLFAVFFVVEAVLLLVDGSLQPPPVAGSSRWRRGFAWALIVYGLAYPAIVAAEGFDYPRMPTFGVPCPLTLITIGYLVASSRTTLRVSAIPILWSLIGG